MVSIIMSVKNAAPFLSECISSIQNQSLKDWELMVVDNFSTDNSRQVLEKFQKTDQRIVLLESDKDDLMAALQQAFNQSKGAYITRMDADDIMNPNKLEMMQERLNKKGKGHVITGLVKYFATSNLGEGFKKYEEWVNSLTLKNDNFKEIYRECVIPSPCWMLYKADLEEIGGFDGGAYPEDYDLCLRMYRQGIKVEGVSKVLHLWRDYPQRASRNELNYKDQLYHKLKWRYFKELELDKNKKLVLWGGGSKAKKMAKTLLFENQAFCWVSNNSKKSGHEIYGVNHQHYSEIESWKNTQVIILVSSEEGKLEIQNFLNPLKVKWKLDFYFFC